MSRSGFYKWTGEAGLPVREVKKPSLEAKLDAARRCFSLRRQAQPVSASAGFSRSSPCKWKRKRLEGYRRMKATGKKAAPKSGRGAKKKKDVERGIPIKDIFFDNKETCGHRRIRAAHEGSEPLGEGQEGKEVQLMQWRD